MGGAVHQLKEEVVEGGRCWRNEVGRGKVGAGRVLMKARLGILGFLTDVLTTRTVACRWDINGECEPASADAEEEGLGEGGEGEEDRGVRRRRQTRRLEVGRRGLHRWVVGLSRMALGEDEV